MFEAMIGLLIMCMAINVTMNMLTVNQKQLAEEIRLRDKANRRYKAVQNKWEALIARDPQKRHNGHT